MTGDPCRVDGEFFVMKRKGVEFEFKVENGSTYSGNGFVIKDDYLGNFNHSEDGLPEY